MCGKREGSGASVSVDRGETRGRVTCRETMDRRVLELASHWQGVHRKAMFGGTCYRAEGNMVAGVYEDHLFLLLGERGAGEALKSGHVRPFDVTGRPMKGWVMVSGEGIFFQEELGQWLEKARRVAGTLSPKE